jgi:hypothetical protein
MQLFHYSGGNNRASLDETPSRNAKKAPAFADAFFYPLILAYRQ